MKKFFVAVVAPIALLSACGYGKPASVPLNSGAALSQTASVLDATSLGEALTKTYKSTHAYPATGVLWSVNSKTSAYQYKTNNGSKSFQVAASKIVPNNNNASLADEAKVIKYTSTKTSFTLCVGFPHYGGWAFYTSATASVVSSGNSGDKCMTDS